MAADPLTSRTVDNLMLEDAGFDTDDDIFGDAPPKNAERDDKPTLSPRKRKAEDEDVFGRNIDEEIKIKKQRKQIPKLDAERLLLEQGVPKVRALVRSGQLKKKLRLKGKGHEFTDAARLLNYYQLWLDNLYPRAKFADAIQLVEKAGHTKKMQMYRKSWIDEGKPGHVRREDMEQAVEQQETNRNQDMSEVQKEHQDNTATQADQDPNSLFLEGDKHNNDLSADVFDDDELDALLAQEKTSSHNLAKQTHADDGSEGEDDLDALLAQESQRRIQPPQPADDEDDLDALLSAQSENIKDNQTKQDSNSNYETPQETEEDDLDALMNVDTTHNIPKISQASGQGDSVADETFNDDFDDLDTILSNQNTTKEPELPMLVSNLKATKAAEQNASGPTPGSEEVPELDNVVSSSPIPNVRTDELDQLMDEHDASINLKKADAELVEEFMSSSPIPNRDSQ